MSDAIPPSAPPGPASDTPTAPNNVLRPAFGQQSVVAERFQFCRHHSYELDEARRTVACGACRVELDAFEVLLGYANKERNWRSWDKESREKQKDLAELKAEEKKVKARTASASRKDATAAVAHERQASFVRRQAVAEKARDIAGLTRQIERLSRVETDAFPGGARRKPASNDIRGAAPRTHKEG